MPKPKLIDYIKLSDVPKLLLKLTGVTRTRSTVYLWVKKGVKNYTGSYVKLHTSKTLKHYYTTEAWVKDFIKEIG